jgi:hypothetical protein
LIRAKPELKTLPDTAANALDGGSKRVGTWQIQARSQECVIAARSMHVRQWAGTARPKDPRTSRSRYIPADSGGQRQAPGSAICPLELVFSFFAAISDLFLRIRFVLHVLKPNPRERRQPANRTAARDPM